jgi:predicted nuclease with TOPRIM domain
MRTAQELTELAARKDMLYSQWKTAENEARQLGQACHQLVVALDEIKARRSELEIQSKPAWEEHNAQQAALSRNIEYYDNIGNENAAQMREYFNRASTAFTDGDKAGAKSLSVMGHDFESKAKEANTAKDYWLKQSQDLRSAIQNSPVEVELRAVRTRIKRLQAEFDDKNAHRASLRTQATKLETLFREAKSEFDKANAEPQTAFTDAMSPGIVLSARQIRLATTRKRYPDYLEVKKIINMTIESKFNPSALPTNCAFVYNDNLYVTDSKGNIAYIDCEMIHTDDAASIRKAHPEYKSVGGANANNDDMDAGHFGISLGQHPSIAMEQDRIMNRYGAWRKFEQDWDRLSKEGHKVNVKAVFVEGGSNGTYSPFWSVQQTIDGNDVSEYNLTNDDTQS